MTRYREFNDRLLVVASHNPGKVREFRDLLANFDIELRAAADLALPEPAETGTSFRENAELKARVAAQTSGLAALADDSGLVVPDLDGDPGIFSARWAGPDKDFDLAMRRVHDELAARGMPDMTKCSAYFACVLSLAWPDGKIESFEGRVYGSLTWPPRGTLGFGYDPMFVAEGYDRTFGEIEPALKHTISHRADAFRQMVRACFNEVRSMSENRC